MRDLDIEKEMYRQAVALIEKRYPIGWGELQPYHWTKAYPAHELEHFEE